MSEHSYHPALHRLAVATACVALLPIIVGAIVTTMKAGMAFRDWPTSDGYNMFFYPWLKSAGDQFLEHGHRLTGILIGLFSIATALAAWLTKPGRLVRATAFAVLLAVVFQGFLGGARVRLDRDILAMVHGSFAALVFSLMCGLALFTSRSWLSASQQLADSRQPSGLLKPLVLTAPIIIFAQFLLGGALRHLGLVLFEHIGFAFVVLLFVFVTAFVAHSSGLSWLRRPAWLLLSIVVIQAGLGLGAFVTRFGFPPSGYVAVKYSTEQVVLGTSHTVVGMFLLATSVVLALRVLRLEAVGRATVTASAAVVAHIATVKGGLA